MNTDLTFITNELETKLLGRFNILIKDARFFDIQGDGSSLSAVKMFNPQYKNDSPKFLELWLTQKAEKPYSWFTSVSDIIENDYNLSANTYNRIVARKKAPTEIQRRFWKSLKI